MKKIFTTLAIFSMVALSANAEVSISYNGKALENGAELTFGNADFEDFGSDGYHYWQVGCDLDVEAGNPSTIKAETNLEDFQVCPSVCLAWKETGDNLYASLTMTESSYGIPIHVSSQDPCEIPVYDAWLKITVTDDDDVPFVVNIKLKTESSAVEGIGMENARVAAIYDMQGRRVADDFRGASIVVYDNGKAVKQIRK